MPVNVNPIIRLSRSPKRKRNWGPEGGQIRLLPRNPVSLQLSEFRDSPVKPNWTLFTIWYPDLGSENLIRLDTRWESQADYTKLFLKALDTCNTDFKLNGSQVDDVHVVSLKLL